MGELRSGEDLPLGARQIEGPMRPVSLRQEPTAPEDDDQDSIEDESIPSQSEARKRRKSAVQEIIETLLLAVLIFVAVRTIVLNFRVDGQSMEPNLQNSELLIVNRRAYVHFNVNWLPWESSTSSDWYPFGKPSRGDIVVFNPPGQHTEPYIKRIIGLPGEKISVHDGAVYINDQRLSRDVLDLPDRVARNRHGGRDSPAGLRLRHGRQSKQQQRFTSVWSSADFVGHRQSLGRVLAAIASKNLVRPVILARQINGGSSIGPVVESIESLLPPELVRKSPQQN